MKSAPQPLLNIDIPAHLEPYVRALGLDGAVSFFLTFGGAPAYVAKNPEKHSAMRDAIGEDGIRALSREIEGRITRVPLPKRWIARVRYAQRRSIYEIARELRATDKTVRQWLELERAERNQQLSLPL